ncbi:MAG: hypothetical protein ACE5GW_06875, partial [Planctomycetota bacterium]
VGLSRLAVISGDETNFQVPLDRVARIQLQIDGEILQLDDSVVVLHVSPDGVRTQLKSLPGPDGWTVAWPAGGGDGIVRVGGRVGHFQLPRQATPQSSPTVVDMDLEPGGMLVLWGKVALFRELLGTTVTIDSLEGEIPEVYRRYRLDLSGLRLPLPTGSYRLRLPRDSEVIEAQFKISTGVEGEVTLR